MSGNIMSEWFENPQFWEDFAPLFFDKERMEVTFEEVNKIIARLSLPANSRILDMACGIGRHSLELARRGFDVTAVDIAEYYLNLLKEQSQRESLELDIVRSDMRSYTTEAVFDAALLMFTSLGYFSDPQDDLKAARNIYQALNPGGHLLIDQMGREIVKRNFQSRDWHEVEGIFWLEERTPDDDWHYLANRWIICKEAKVNEYTFRIKMYSATELSELLKSAGFKKIQVYGDLSGTPYDEKAKRLIVIGQK
jgi:SAM-dependent methyltransferase